MSKKNIASSAVEDQATDALLETVKTLSLPVKSVEILECDGKGIVKFSAPMSDLGLNESQASVFKAQKTGFLADVVGEALVRGNLDKFSILMDNKHEYAKFCEIFEHRHFVALADNRKACFRFHVSLLHRIHNEILAETIKDPKAPAVAREDSYICAGIKSSPKDAREETGSPYEVLLRYLKEIEWNYHENKLSDDDRKIIETGVNGRNGKYPVRIVLWLKREQIVFHSFLPVAVPGEKRPPIAEYIVRANYGTIIGNFEMDYSDGEVNYKTSLDFEDDRLSVALIRQLAIGNAAIFSKYWPGFFKVLYADADPAGAIKEIESKE